MRRLHFLIPIIIATLLGCAAPQVESPSTEPSAEDQSTPLAETFAYPISLMDRVTEAKDNDGWYNALDFGEQNHLGEDWNKDSGGNSDCGEPVHATANGWIVFAGNAGPGWGNVIIIVHRLPSGDLVQSLYGHLSEISIGEGEVTKRQKIGRIGDANGRYPCHLHFELRTRGCPVWNVAGAGYSAERNGWVDPSEFIDQRR